jgi:hypothetical protein
MAANANMTAVRSLGNLKGRVRINGETDHSPDSSHSIS